MLLHKTFNETTNAHLGLFIMNDCTLHNAHLRTTTLMFFCLKLIAVGGWINLQVQGTCDVITGGRQITYHKAIKYHDRENVTVLNLLGSFSESYQTKNVQNININSLKTAP